MRPQLAEPRASAADTQRGCSRKLSARPLRLRPLCRPESRPEGLFILPATHQHGELTLWTHFYAGKVGFSGIDLFLLTGRSEPLRVASVIFEWAPATGLGAILFSPLRGQPDLVPSWGRVKEERCANLWLPEQDLHLSSTRTTEAKSNLGDP